MKPSAKRALLLPAWPERRLWGQAAGVLQPVACGRIRGVLAGGVRAFLGPCAARQWCGELAVGGWLTSGKRAVGLVCGSAGRPNAATGAIASLVKRDAAAKNGAPRWRRERNEVGRRVERGRAEQLECRENAGKMGRARPKRVVRSTAAKRTPGQPDPGP